MNTPQHTAEFRILDEDGELIGTADTLAHAIELAHDWRGIEWFEWTETPSSMLGRPPYWRTNRPEPMLIRQAVTS